MDSAMADSLAVQLSAEALAAYNSRSRSERERVHRVNEYALWCLDREMWDEARIHLEQALHTDSLAASLHNNLGIVYERLGRRKEAVTKYQMAAALNPGRPLYESNLKRLRTVATRPIPVPSDSLAAQELQLTPTPRGTGRQNVGAMPRRLKSEADLEFP